MIVLERAPEGCLEDRLTDIREGKEQASLIYAMLKAVAAMHEKNVVWADCKLRNFLLLKLLPAKVSLPSISPFLICCVLFM